MKHGTKVGLGPGHIVLDKYSAPPTGAQSPPTFGPCLFWLNGWMDQDAIRYELGLGPGDIVLHGGPSSPRKRGTASTFRPMSIVATRIHASGCHLVRR